VIAHFSPCIAGLGLALGLTACTSRYDLAPPPSGEQVTVTVKVPQDLAADTMRVMYRSQKCPIKRSGADWTTYEEDGRHTIDVVPQRQGQSDLYVAKLDRSGGGPCQWNLSNVTFGVHYENTAQFGADVKYGYGGGVIVIFDNNLPQQRDMYGAEDVEGDVSIGKDYYPWLLESRLAESKRTIILLSGNSVYTYRAKSARDIYFAPILHGG
jgi:hypothetical protein